MSEASHAPSGELTVWRDLAVLEPEGYGAPRHGPRNNDCPACGPRSPYPFLVCLNCGAQVHHALTDRHRRACEPRALDVDPLP